MTKKKLLISLAAPTIVAIGAVWLQAKPVPAPIPMSPVQPIAIPAAVPPAPAPTVGTPTVTPTIITLNTPIMVTTAVQITDSTLLPGGVNLLRLLNATGTQSTILGVMHDDGVNGDVIANDKIFSLRSPFNETTAGQIRLQASAAFKGQLKRVLSSVVSISALSPQIGWSPAAMTVFLSPGDSSLFYVGLSSNQALSNISLALDPSLSSVVELRSALPLQVNANQEYRIAILFKPSATTPTGTYSGNLRFTTTAVALGQPLPLVLTVRQPSQDSSVTWGPAGGTATLPNGIGFSVPAGVLASDVIFKLKSYPRSTLASSVPASVPVYANVEVNGQSFSGAAATTKQTFSTTIVLPLVAGLPPGTVLEVLQQTMAGKNWGTTGATAIVDANGQTATFTVHTAGLLLLVKPGDRGIENTP